MTTQAMAGPLPPLKDSPPDLDRIIIHGGARRSFASVVVKTGGESVSWKIGPT